MNNQAEVYAHNMKHFMGSPQVSNLLNDVFRQPKWQEKEHRCPRCNRAVTDLTEYNFMQSANMCGTCDSVQGEIDAERLLEAKDVLSGMAEANEMSVEDYLEAL